MDGKEDQALKISMKNVPRQAQKDCWVARRICLMMKSVNVQLRAWHLELSHVRSRTKGE